MNTAEQWITSFAEEFEAALTAAANAVADAEAADGATPLAPGAQPPGAGPDDDEGMNGTGGGGKGDGGEDVTQYPTSADIMQAFGAALPGEDGKQARAKAAAAAHRNWLNKRRKPAGQASAQEQSG